MKHKWVRFNTGRHKSEACVSHVSFGPDKVELMTVGGVRVKLPAGTNVSTKKK